MRRRIARLNRDPCAASAKGVIRARLPSTMHVRAEFSQGRGLDRANPVRRLFVTFGKHPAGNCRLEGGRSSLLESAQEATLSSVSTFRFMVNESRAMRRLESGPSFQMRERTKRWNFCAVAPASAATDCD